MLPGCEPGAPRPGEPELLDPLHLPAAAVAAVHTPPPCQPSHDHSHPAAALAPAAAQSDPALLDHDDADLLSEVRATHAVHAGAFATSNLRAHVSNLLSQLARGQLHAALELLLTDAESELANLGRLGADANAAAELRRQQVHEALDWHSVSRLP